MTRSVSQSTRPRVACSTHLLSSRPCSCPRSFFWFPTAPSFRWLLPRPFPACSALPLTPPFLANSHFFFRPCLQRRFFQEGLSLLPVSSAKPREQWRPGLGVSSSALSPQSLGCLADTVSPSTFAYSVTQQIFFECLLCARYCARCKGFHSEQNQEPAARELAGQPLCVCPVSA